MKRIKVCFQILFFMAVLFQTNNTNAQCYITPGLNIYQNHVNCHDYEVYATSGTNTVNYDRHVSIMFSTGGNIIETAVVIIPANQHLSNNVVVFPHHSTQVGNVTMAVVNVATSSGTIDNSCVWRSINTSVFNCPRTNPEGDRDTGLIDIEAELRGSRTP